MSETAAVITAITALCAVILGPLVSIWSEKVRASVTVLSGNRQVWINDLRNLIAEFVSVVYYINGSRRDPCAQSSHLDKAERLLLIYSKIELMINPNEENHIELLEALKILRDATVKHEGHAPTNAHANVVREELAKLTKCAQAVLKSEWVRVKKMR